MRTVISFAGLKPPLPVQREESLGLHWLAGGNVLSHILQELENTIGPELVILAGRDAGVLADWLGQWDPGLELRALELDGDVKPLEALLALRPYLNGQQLLLVQGNTITQADYLNLADTEADVVCYAEGGESAACWFRQDTDLFIALERAQGAITLADLATYLAANGRNVLWQQTTSRLDVGTLAGLLAANARLLALGSGSEDAIERSYLEDFTVIPPVFVHKTAEIEKAVLGPFVNIEAGAVVRNSVLRNTLVGVEAQVADAVLDGAVIGDGAEVHGSALSIMASAGSNLLIDTVQEVKTGQ